MVSQQDQMDTDLLEVPPNNTISRSSLKRNCPSLPVLSAHFVGWIDQKLKGEASSYSFITQTRTLPYLVRGEAPQ